jgi:hypothetical protein
MSHLGNTVLKLILGPERNQQMQLERNKETITHLKFIGTFQPAEKIDVRNLQIETNNIFTPIKRMLLGESRNTTLGFLSGTIERSFDIISSYVHSDRTSDRIYCTNIVSDLLKAVNGLKNVQKTYKEDKLFMCQIDTVIESIQGKLTELQEKFPVIMPPETQSVKQDHITVHEVQEIPATVVAKEVQKEKKK